jgi:hypothetical protein
MNSLEEVMSAKVNQRLQPITVTDSSIKHKDNMCNADYIL